jgi:hypothetical protein
VRLPTTIISRMNNIFNNIRSRIATSVFHPFRTYLSTPIGKITILNSTLFVHLSPCSYCGRQRGCLKVSWSSTSPLNVSTSPQTGSTRLSLMPSRISPPCISVWHWLLSHQHVGSPTDGSTCAVDVWKTVRMGALLGGGVRWFCEYELFDAL